MKRLAVILLLISHINFSMFIAQVDEVDVFGATGEQLPDVNSLTDYLANLLVSNPENPKKDTDDDSARYFHIVKIDSQLFNQQFTVINQPVREAGKSTSYPDLVKGKLPIIFFEISSPPPEV